MKKSIIITAAIFAYCILLTANCFSQGTAINTTGAPADNSAILDVGGNITSSPYMGMLIPRLTTAKRDSIISPAEGLMIFNLTSKCVEMFVSGTWNTGFCPAACNPPASPVAASAGNIACTSFTANWSSSSGANNYYLDVATDAGFTSFVSGYNNLNVGNATSASVTGLVPASNYYYRVRAFTACLSGNSNTIGPVATESAPASPVAGTHVPSQTQITWDWSDVANATGYQWNTADTYPGAGVNVVAPSTYTQTSLTCETAYTLYVWAYNACGHSASVQLTQTTSSCCICPALSTWEYKTPVTINNIGGPALTNFQLLVVINTASLIPAKMRSDCGDIRFTDNNQCSQLYSWIESGINTSSTYIWVKVPGIPANSNYTIYFYYGNSGVTFDGVYAGEAPQLSGTYAAYDNGSSVFNFYDNFAGTTLSSLWNTYTSCGTVSVNNGLTENVFAACWGTYIVTKTAYPSNQVFTTLMKQTTNFVGADAAMAFTTAPNIPSSTYAAFMWDAPNTAGFVYGYNDGGSGFTWPPSGSTITPAINTFYLFEMGINSSGHLSYGAINRTSMGSYNTSYAITNGYIVLQNTQTSATWQYIYSRNYPPNGAMPGTSCGSEQPSCP